MTATPSATPTRPARGTRALAWTVLVASVLQVVAPVVTINGPGSSLGGGSGPELLITPVGWAFSIWGVIYSLAIAQAIAVLVRGAGGIPRRLQVDQIVLYLGGAVWIVLAGLDSSLATAVALLVMLVAAVDGILTAARASISPRWLAILTRTSVGLYAGWVTAAFFLNASTAMVDAGLVEADQQRWQLVVLVVTTLALLALIAATRSNLAYAAAGIWALFGIAVTGASNDDSTVITFALVGAVVLVGATLALRVSGGRATAH